MANDLGGRGYDLQCNAWSAIKRALRVRDSPDWRRSGELRRIVTGDGWGRPSPMSKSRKKKKPAKRMLALPDL